MAGAGYKLFNTGDVLTAAQVNTYLQEQVVMVFASATARTTALSGVLAEGMVSYLQDTNAVEVYDGSNWVGIGSSGDITGVTAGTGISGGGTSGTVTITNDMATTITAAGDIVVGTGSGTYDNLPIGTTGQVLTADTTVSPYKVKWAAAAGGGKVLQVVSGTLLDNYQGVKTASATDITGMSITITPSATSSKILLLGALNGNNSQGSSPQQMTLDIVNSSNTKLFRLYDGDLRTFGSSIQLNMPFSFLHSPASTSSLTYKLRIVNDTSGVGLYVNNGNSGINSQMVALEIGA